MIYSKSSEYAIRILTFFVRTGGPKPLKMKTISLRTGVPQAYTAKVLLCLVKKKFLTSEPGPQGGFSAASELSKRTLLEVVAAIDNFPQCQFRDCVMGLKECNDKNPCVLHDAWMETGSKVIQILSKTTFQMFVREPSSFRTGPLSRITLSKSMRNIFGHIDVR